MKKQTILVTGIGGNVGQGILRNIRETYPEIRLVGTNTLAFSAGNHLCDKVYEVPISYAPGYIDAMQKIVAEEQIDLLIPSTDFEVYYLSLHKAEIGKPVLASGAEAAAVFLDKYLTAIEFEKHGIPFAQSVLPSVYNHQFAPVIAKPRKGRGSRGIVLNPADPQAFSDDEYLLQELAKGKEITTAFYVTRDKQLLGHITMERSLENGTTSHCQVNRSYDAALEPMILAIIRHFDVAGSLNIQSIVTADGRIVPFEVNARISGTNSIRGNFGFRDVCYGVEEWLYHRRPEQPVIREGLAVRILMDVIYPGSASTKGLDQNAQHHLF